MSFGGLLASVLELGKGKLMGVLKLGDSAEKLTEDPDSWVFGYYRFRAAKVYQALKVARASGGDTNEVLATLGIDIPEDD